MRAVRVLQHTGSQDAAHRPLLPGATAGKGSNAGLGAAHLQRRRRARAVLQIIGHVPLSHQLQHVSPKSHEVPFWGVQPAVASAVRSGKQAGLVNSCIQGITRTHGCKLWKPANSRVQIQNMGATCGLDCFDPGK